MGGLHYIAGFPVANCTYVLCGAGLACDYSDVKDGGGLDDERGDMHSTVAEEVTCPNCIYLLSIPGSYRLNVSGRRAKLRPRKRK